MRQSAVKVPSVPKFAKRCFFLAAGFLVAAAIVLLCINLSLQSSGVEQRIRDAALRSLGTEVQIRSTMYTPWSGLVLRGISVADPTNANLNIVEATALRVRFSFVPLLKNRFVITECTLFEPKDPEYRQIPFSVTGRIDNPKTDLLDRLIGAKVGQDVGGMLMNILRSSVP
jgi:hypothetical protein